MDYYFSEISSNCAAAVAAVVVPCKHSINLYKVAYFAKSFIMLLLSQNLFKKY
jgi:hypothetical protein